MRGRLGEIRNGSLDGLWSELIYSRDKIRGLAGTHSKRTAVGFMLGLDQSFRINDNNNLLVGGAFKYVYDRLRNLESSGKADDRVSGALFYLTWAHKKGSYADFILDFDRYHQKLTSTLTDGNPVRGNYTLYGAGLSLEVGHQFRFGNDSSYPSNSFWYLEPQLQLSYFHAPEKSYSLSNGMIVTQSSQNSVMGRMGLVVGKEFQLEDDKTHANLFLSAGLKHEFSSNRNVRVNNLDFDHDFGRTTGYIGMGTVWNFAKDTNLFAHIEHERGNGYTKDIEVRLGAKVSTESLNSSLDRESPKADGKSSKLKLYGLIDSGVYFHHASHQNSITEMESGITKGSRWGITGSEDLGRGYSAFFTLEQGFDSCSGEPKTEGSAFDRDSFLGIGTPIGSLAGGRTGTLSSGNNGGLLGGLSPFGITWKEAGLTKIFSGNIAARVSNMVRFESASFNNIQLYGQYSNGINSDETASAEKNRYLAFGLTYRKSRMRLAAVFDNYFFNDSPVKTEEGVTAGKNLKNMRTYNIGGSYEFNDVRVYLGYQHGQNVKTPRQGDATLLSAAKYSSKDLKATEGYTTNAWTVGTDIDLWGGQLKTTLGYARAVREFENSKARVFQAGLGYKYPLSKDLYIYAATGYLRAKSETNGETGRKSEKVNTASVFSGLCYSF